MTEMKTGHRRVCKTARSAAASKRGAGAEGCWGDRVWLGLVKSWKVSQATMAIVAWHQMTLMC